MGSADDGVDGVRDKMETAVDGFLPEDRDLENVGPRIRHYDEGKRRRTGDQRPMTVHLTPWIDDDCHMNKSLKRSFKSPSYTYSSPTTRDCKPEQNWVDNVDLPPLPTPS